MDPNVWGPPAWEFLHSVTFQYPENPANFGRKKYYSFFESLKHVIPCPTCKSHYTQHFERYPIRLDSRKDLIEWLIDIHNEVNKITNKKLWSYDDVYKKYNKMYDGSAIKTETSKKSSTLNILLIFLVISVIACIVYYRQSKGKPILPKLVNYSF